MKCFNLHEVLEAIVFSLKAQRHATWDTAKGIQSLAHNAQWAREMA